MDKNLFMLASLEDQLNCVREEAMALTIERFLLPVYSRLNNQLDYQKYYELILQRICTTLTKGFFRDFSIDHYYDIIKCPKDLNNICQQIQLDQYYDGNIFTINEIFYSIFDLLDAKSIYNLSLTDLYFYNKLNNPEFKNRYLTKLLGFNINLIKYDKIYTFGLPSTYTKNLCRDINLKFYASEKLTNYINTMINNYYPVCIVNINHESKDNYTLHYEDKDIVTIDTDLTFTFIDKAKKQFFLNLDLNYRSDRQYIYDDNYYEIRDTINNTNYNCVVNINNFDIIDIKYHDHSDSWDGHGSIELEPPLSPYSDDIYHLIFIYLSFIVLNNLYSLKDEYTFLNALKQKLDLEDYAKYK